MKSPQAGLQQNPGCSTLMGLCSCQDLSGSSGAHWVRASTSAQSRARPPHSFLFSLSPPFPCVIDGTRAGELSLTIFPNTERRKCCGGGAGSIFVKEPVNVKPALIYSGEL